MIAIVYPQFYGVGGIARYLDLFLQNLPKNHPKIYLLTGDEFAHSVSYLSPKLELVHIPFSSSRVNLFKWGYSIRQKLISLYDEDKIKVVNFHFPPLIPGLFLPRHIPMVLTSHTTYLGMSGNFYDKKLFTSQWSPLSIWIKTLMERVVFSKANKVIALTEQGRQEVLSYGFKGKIDVIPNGTDVGSFTPDNNAIKDIDVIFSGRIERRKGSQPMVLLCEKLVNFKPDIKISIVGYGDDEEVVRDALKKYSANITLVGKVPFTEMVDFYRRSKVYVSTSYYEGLPGTCLEAMSMQLPVVVWDLLFYQNLVLEGKTGSLAQVNNIDSMVDKVICLLSDDLLSSRLGVNARKLLIEEYSWKNLAIEVLNSFERVKK